jgi:hypothetical protein
MSVFVSWRKNKMLKIGWSVIYFSISIPILIIYNLTQNSFIGFTIGVIFIVGFSYLLADRWILYLKEEK